MGRLIYSTIASLDGRTADADGRFDWMAPDDEVHRHVGDLVRRTGTHLYGRRMYEVMVAWETMTDPEPSMRDFAQVWRAADKVVYSTTLDEVASERTRIEPAFEPDAVRDFVRGSDRDVLVGGAHLAGQALAAGLVDEVHVYLAPLVLGGGTRWMPSGASLDLALVDVHRFASGVVHLHHEVVR